MNYQFLSLSLALSLLAGCAGSNNFVTPVEERSLAPVIAPPSGTVIPVEQSEQVVVAPIYDAPSFEPRAKTPSEQQPAPQPVQQSMQSMNRAAEPTMPSLESSSNTAVVALLGDAQQSAGRGDFAAAESQVERALRISPRDPQIYLQLAAVKRQQREYLQAEQVALRGVALSAGLPDFKRKLWRELALIRTQAGDFGGAAQAQAESERP